MKAMRFQKSRIAVRVIITNIIVIVAMLLAITATAAITITGVAGTASERLAYIYALESVGKFNAHANYDLALLRMAAQSEPVREWFADEGDLDKKIAAYHELMNFAELLQSGEFYFGIYESLNEFSIDKTTPFDGFIPYGTMSRDDPMDAWFFDLLASDNDFLFNIDVDKVEDRWRIWINYKVIYDGRAIGVLCTSIRIEDVLHSMFGEHFEGGVMGFVVDRFGAIHMDSTSLEHYSTFADELPYIGEMDPALKGFVENFLHRHEGFFTAGLSPEIIRLEGRQFSHAAIVPIADSAWMVITLFDRDALFSPTQLFPYTAVLIFSLALYMAFGIIITRRYVLMPLTNLAESVSLMSGTENTAVYGYERNDEIGVLSRAIQHAQKKLKHREDLLNIVNNAATRLLVVEDSGGFENALTHSMEIIGKFLNADRVVLLRAELVANEYRLATISNWLSETGLENPQTDFNEAIPIGLYHSLDEMFFSGKCFNGAVSDLPDAEQQFVDPHNILKSVAILPLLLDGKLWGVFGIGYYISERLLSGKEMDIMRSAGLMFVSVFSRIAHGELAVTDALTGMKNRMFFMEEAKRELQNCIFRDKDFSLIIADIDSFKSVNDRYGHNIGDEVLKIFAARISNALKRDTLVSRYGGEEFVVTLPEADHKSALKAAWRLNNAIAQSPFRIKDLELRITASFGVASKESNRDTLLTLTDNADRALYRAKESGRNTVVGIGGTETNDLLE